MAFIPVETVRYSNTVLREEENMESREVVTVNMAAGATLALGTVLARAKSADPDAAYDIVKTTDLADSATALGKEYAVLIGDIHKVQDEVTFVTATAKKAFVLVREALLKEEAVLAIHDAALNDTEWKLLKGAMSKQKLLVEPSAPAAAVV